MFRDTGHATAVGTLASHLLVAIAALGAGVVLGGWVAFETGDWRSFKAGIESLSGLAIPLVVGLLTLAVGTGAAAAYTRTAGS